MSELLTKLKSLTPAPECLTESEDGRYIVVRHPDYDIPNYHMSVMLIESLYDRNPAADLLMTDEIKGLVEAVYKDRA